MEREEEVFDPIITKAFEKWKKSFSWKWMWFWGFLLGSMSLITIGSDLHIYKDLTLKSEWRFVVVSVMSLVIMMEVRLPWLVGKMIRVSLKLRNDSDDARCGSPKEYPQALLRGAFHLRAYVLWVMWMVGVVAVKRVGWFAENIDNGTALFLLYLPAVWLFRIPRVVNGFFALIIIPFLPFFLSFGMERTAEVWAVLLYFLLVVATVQMVKEVRNEND